MNTRPLALGAMLAAATSAAIGFLACATDGGGALPGPPDDGTRLEGDAGAAADAPAEAAVDPDPCLPDALCPGGPFTATGTGLPLDRRARINVIRGRSATDVWVGGASGAIAHYDGQTWTRSDLGAKASIRVLWLRGTEEIAIASASSYFVRGLSPLDAGVGPSPDNWIDHGQPAWSGMPEMPGLPGMPTSGWASPLAEWFWLTTVQVDWTTDEPQINGLWRLRVDPATDALGIENPLPHGACKDLNCRRMMSVHGISADDLWAVGMDGAALRVTAAQSPTPVITPLNSMTRSTLNGVWAAAENDVWAVGAGGVIRHYTGDPVQWDVVTNVAIDPGISLNAVWGTSSSDVWGVGDRALVLHYDGKQWSRVPVGGLAGLRPDLYSVWTAEPGHVWIGGDGTVLSIGGKP